MEPTDVLTVALARQAFLTAFWLSQGDEKLQHLLLDAIAARRPMWTLSEDAWQALGQLTDTVYALAEKGVHDPFGSREVVQQELEKQRDWWRSSFVRGWSARMAEYERMLYRIIAGFIERDYWYLVVSARCRPKVEKPRSCHVDQHLSFVCHYLLLRNQTGCLVFDEVLADMAGCVQRGGFFRARRSFPDATRANLARVIAMHNHWHPEAQVNEGVVRRSAITVAHPETRAS